jgi:methyl-accepting chemotaxis protein
MDEQTRAASDITTATTRMRRESDQLARAMGEQARAMNEMRGASQNTSRQIGLMLVSSRAHSASVANILLSLSNARQLTERSAQGLQEHQRVSASLREQAQLLAALRDRLSEHGGR